MTATYAIIPTSGRGERLTKDSTGKTFVPIAGRPLIAHTLSVFQNLSEIKGIVLVARPSDISSLYTLVDQYHFTKVISIVSGAATRQQSVQNGLDALPPDCDVVVIHDGARPFVSADIIISSISASRLHGASIAALPVIDTIAMSSDHQFVTLTPDRKQLYSVQTPQTFQVDLIKAAYHAAVNDNFSATDDASVVTRLGKQVAIVAGSYQNFKITVPNDLILAEAVAKELTMSPEEGQRNCHVHDSPLSMRIGHGYDIHRFADNRRLYLGGVEFPEEEGLLGHSDADVLLHAVSDAILGALGENDIGLHFPDTDEAFKDAKSTKLLAHVVSIAKDKGWKVGNVDITLIAQKPKISSRKAEMRATIASILEIEVDNVNLKATTAEGLGAIGECKGIECHAVTLLVRSQHETF